jgi:hypothetical protein
MLSSRTNPLHLQIETTDTNQYVLDITTTHQTLLSRSSPAINKAYRINLIPAPTQESNDATARRRSHICAVARLGSRLDTACLVRLQLNVHNPRLPALRAPAHRRTSKFLATL